jgi:hypothetical protein
MQCNVSRKKDEVTTRFCSMNNFHLHEFHLLLAVRVHFSAAPRSIADTRHLQVLNHRIHPSGKIKLSSIAPHTSSIPEIASRLGQEWLKGAVV